MPKQETTKGGLGILSCTRKEISAQKSNRACKKRYRSQIKGDPYILASKINDKLILKLWINKNP